MNLKNPAIDDNQDQDAIAVAEKAIQKSATPVLYLALFQAYLVYSFRDNMNLIIGIGVVVAFILIYFGIRKMILIAPVIGLSIGILDTIFLALSMVGRYLIFDSIPTSFLFHLPTRLVFIVAFIRIIRSIDAYRKLVNASR